MIVKSDYHVHSTFCDGNDTPESIIIEAIDRGLDVIGFSSHAHTPFFQEWCMSLEGTQKYIQNINQLKEKYASKIQVLCGVEWDYYSDGPRSSFDYIIGSVHFLQFGNEVIPIDESPQILADAVSRYCNGSFLNLASAYYDLVGQVVDQTGCNIIGHFDLISKFNEKCRLFNEKDPAYISLWKKAIDKLLEKQVVFEINTGAISRGWRTTPYPSPEIYDYLRNHGGRFILSSDSHKKEHLLFAFDKYKNLL